MAKAGYSPDRGDIIWLDLDPRTGREQSGHRPCLVLSDTLLVQRTNMCVVCPITSKVKGLPFEIIVDEQKTKGAVLPIHVRSVNLRARSPKLIEKMRPEVTRQVQNYVRVIIGETPDS